MSAEIIVLRLVHILGGMFWVGAITFMTVFLAPVLTSVGPAAGGVMTGLARRRLLTVVPIAAILSMLSGFRLMQIASVGFSAEYFNSPVGRTFAWAGTFAIVAFIVGMAFARPAAMRAARIGELLAIAPDEAARLALTSELNAVRRRGEMAGIVTVTLLILASAGMATARYME